MGRVSFVPSRFWAAKCRGKKAGHGFPQTELWPISLTTAWPKPPEENCVSRKAIRRRSTDSEKTKLSALSAEFNKMKVLVRKLVVLLSVGALSAVASSAASLEQAYLASCRHD